MHRKAFTKQLLLTVSFVLAALLIFGAAIQFLLFQERLRSVREQLESTARAVGSMVEIFSDTGSTQEEVVLRFELDYTARATGQDVVLCDETGTVTACSCGLQNCSHLGYTLDLSAFSKKDGAETASVSRLAPGLYEEERIAVLQPVSGEAAHAGYVVVSTPRAETNQVMKRISLTHLRLMLFLVPVMVLAVYLVVRRQNRPLKELTEAARRLGRGQMDARVTVDPKDPAEIQELAVAFNNMADELSKTESTRQEFVANVSHELKTPMTTISGYMDGMLDGTIPPEDHPRYMQIISDEVKRLSRLVRNMLDVSRLRDKGLPPEKKRTFDLCETVGVTLINFEQKINSKELNVEVDLPEQGAPALGDPDAVAQVVYNLLDNAVKFCDRGGTLSLKVGQTSQNRWLCSVSNTGPTIDPEDLPLVFDRFHKTDKSRSVDKDGVGLGLYIVKTIICSHGEAVLVTSRDGVTTFSFTMTKA